MFKATCRLFIALLTLGMFAGHAAAGDTSGQTKHPVVLVHGLSGFDTLIIDYFFGVKRALRDVGVTQIYTPQLTGYDNSEARGEELLAYLEELKAVTGASKFNLIGHSQGGIDSRYVASVRPDLIASVTSVGSPHLGSDTADLIKDSPVEGLVLDIGNAVGTFLAVLTGDSSQKQNAMGSLESLNSEGAAIYNAKYPEGLRTQTCREAPVYNIGSWLFPVWYTDYSVNDGAHEVNGVKYFSWTGIYNPVVDSNVLDAADALLGVTWLTFDDENDGLVGRCSTHLGKVIRDDYIMNHLDEVNGFLGLRGLWSTDPIPLFQNHARRLKQAGL